MRHVVALSGGKDSTAMALRLAEVEPRDYEYVITPTGDELPEMIDHWKRLGQMLGSPLRAIGTKSLEGEIRRQNCLPNWRMRWCTRILKLEPFQAYLLRAAPCVTYVGIRADEADREGADHDSMEGVEQRLPLLEWNWTLADVRGYLRERGVTVPGRTDCGMCFFQRLGEWYQLWAFDPERFRRYEEIEERVGHTLRSDSRDTWPAALKDLRREFERGRIPRPAPGGVSGRKRMCGICAR